MQRIMIVGGPGAGKSTLAREIGACLNLPVFHMDREVHWQDNWVERSAAEKLPLVQAIEARAEWVLEGGVSSTYASRIGRADQVIWLDLPVRLRLWRVTKRLWRYLGVARPDLPDGCVERLHPQTLVFYWFIWSSRHTSRAKIAKALEGGEQKGKLAHLKTPADVMAFVRTLNRDSTLLSP